MAMITIYTTSWCGYCFRTKRYLDAAGIPYDEVDVDRHPEVGERIKRATGGYRTVPTLEIGDTLLVNPRPAEIEAALATAIPASGDRPSS